MEMLMSLKTICIMGFTFVAGYLFFINKTLNKAFAEYYTTYKFADRMRREDVDNIRSQLYSLNAQMQELLKIEKEKRNILKEKDGDSKALLESLIRSVDRLYVDKNE